MSLAERIPEIYQAVSTNYATLLVSPTGTGKSTLLPGVLARAGNKVMVSAPPVQAVKTLYETMSNELSGQISIGYAAEGEIHYNESTQLVYATAGHVKNYLLRYVQQKRDNPSLQFPFNILIVDEVHTSTLETALIISIWSYLIRRGLIGCRLLMMSATPNMIYVEPQPKVITIEQISKYVRPVYLDKDPDMRNVRTMTENSNDIFTVAARQTWIMHQQLLSENDREGGILVFAAGQQEIIRVVEFLEKMPNAKQELHILPAYGGMGQIKEIYKPPPAGKRKIIVATNLIQSSVTILGLVVVIDMLLEKRAETNDSGGMRLALRDISRADADQRKGRVGREQEGICVRLRTEKTFNSLKAHSPTEAERLPIEFSVVELMRAGINPIDVQFAQLGKIESAISNLLTYDMIKRNALGGYETTDLGNFVPQFPLALRNGTFLYHWIQQQLPATVGVRVACLIDCWGPYYWKPARSADPETYAAAVAHHQRWAGMDDLSAALLLFDDIMATFHNTLSPNKNDLRRWCDRNYLNYKKVKELLHIMVQCSEQLRRMGYEAYNTRGLNDHTEITNNVLRVALPIFKDNVLYHVGRGIYRKRGNATNIYAEGSSTNSLRDLKPDSILSFIIRETVQTDMAMWYASFSVINPQIDEGSSSGSQPKLPEDKAREKAKVVLSETQDQRIQQVTQSLNSLDFNSW